MVYRHMERVERPAAFLEGGAAMSKQARVCPLCGREYTEPPALSRADNTTDICPACGMMEALASIPGWRESPAERTRRAVYATGNRWARENFDATHN